MEVLPPSLKMKTNWQRDVIIEAEWIAACHDVVTYLAGPMAEEMQQGRTYAPDPNNPRNDDEKQVVGRLGRMCGPKYQSQDAPLQESLACAHAIIKKHWPEIDAVARELMKRRALTGEEARTAIEAAEGDSGKNRTTA